jgi:hypothetical protein
VIMWWQTRVGILNHQHVFVGVVLAYHAGALLAKAGQPIWV